MRQHQHRSGNTTGNLRLAFFLNLGFTLLEIIGGLWTNSIAILSDALHDLGTQGETVRAIHATLETLGKRIVADDAAQLAAQLPQEIGHYLAQLPNEYRPLFTVGSEGEMRTA